MAFFKSIGGIVTALLIFLASGGAAAGESTAIRSEKHNFNVVTLVEGLQNPWSIAWLPDGRMLVTERPGRLRIVSKDFKLAPKPIEGLPKIVVSGQGGLFRRAASGLQGKWLDLHLVQRPG